MSSSANSLPSRRRPQQAIPRRVGRRVAGDRGAEAVDRALARRLGEEVFDGTPDELRALIAEQLLRARVAEQDAVVAVDLDDRVRRVLEHAGLLLGLLAPGDVADDAAEEAPVRGLPGRERELDRELGAVRAQADDLDGLADDARGLRALGHAADAGVVHRAEALRHQHRQRAADDVGLAQPEHALRGRVPGQHAAVVAGGDHRVVRGLGERAEALLGVAQRRLGARARDQAPELAADVRHDLQQAVIGRDGVRREALDHGVGLAEHRDREGEAAPQPRVGGARAAGEVGVRGQVDDPLGAPALEHAAGQPDTAGHDAALGLLAEAREPHGVAQVPQRRRHGVSCSTK